MGGGADAGAGLGSLIGQEYHRMMTSEPTVTFLSTIGGRKHCCCAPLNMKLSPLCNCPGWSQLRKGRDH
ncbi:hypothetical protein AMC87_CH02473 [Rhizobium phaseoli]|nr:hypothetical protein AMC87_CH02473 [Rhizobium phaseoli]